MLMLWCNGTFANPDNQYFLPCPWLVGVACFVFGFFLIVFSCLLRAVWDRRKYAALLSSEDDEDVLWEKKPAGKDIDF
ncbi:Ba67.1 [Baboon cytomegalovirus]|nr:Ba67.1 [Baboon cytomegalovirus]